MSLKPVLGLTLIFSLFVLFTHQVVKAAVDLVKFTAIAQDDAILIEWETATEINNAGFYLTRDTDINPPYETISDFIPAKGSGVIGEEYQFLDEDVTSGMTYYYILEAVDSSLHVEYHGPISVTFTTQVTPTPTKTPSKTPITKTPTPSTKTPTPTKTRTPENTITPTTPTITPTPYTETPTPTETPSITPSPTLLEAPEIVLILPTINTPIPTIEITTPLSLLTPTPIRSITQIIESGTFAMIGVICLVVLVWAAIAVGIFIYIQKRVSSS